MRRVLAALLCIAVLLPCFCVGVNAQEKYTFYKINIDAGSGIISEKAIVQDGEIYISATNFSNYTRFSFDEETKTFLIKGQELKKAFKSVVIDIAKKRMLVSGKKFFDLSDCFEIEGELYLPLCQMLPILNADIYEVKDGVIYISNNKLSLAEVLYDFDISDYYFNISTEFYDMDWAALLTIVPNYVWDTVVDVRFDRLDIVYNSGEYNDYKDAFSSFLSDDNLYLKAMADDASAIDSTVEFFNKANSTAKDMKSVYGWIEAAGKSEISSKTGGVLLDSLKAYYDSGDLKTDDLKGLNDAWTSGKISFGDCIEILTYVYTYATQVGDNRQMLNAVYNVDSKVSKKETARKAAKQVYDLYGDNIVPALYKEIATTVASDALEDLSPIGVYTATAKVAGTVLETFMPFEPGEIAKLPVYSDIVLSAASKYRSYDTSTDESTENLRLSLLLCMIASKKCFEVMGDVFDDQDAAYYNNKIEKIEQLIMGLYIAEENTEFDSFEHFEEYKKANLKEVEALLKAPLQEATNRLLVDYLGKTILDIKNDFGENFKLSALAGSSTLYYASENMEFILDKYYESPPDKAQISSILSYGDVIVINDLHGNMSFGEIKEAIGNAISLPEPEKYYSMMDEAWLYQLEFEYADYTIVYLWESEPSANVSTFVQIMKTTRTEQNTSKTTIEQKEQDGTKENNIWEIIPDKYIFSSGAGAWATEITISDDGSFVGIYHDADMGDIQTDYPNGVIYCCNFKGKFSTPEKKDEYIYYVKLEELTIETQPGKVSYEGGIKYIYSEPYGFDNAKDFYIYLPHTPTQDIENGFWEWSQLYDYYNISSLPDNYYGIYNIQGKQGFVSYSFG